MERATKTRRQVAACVAVVMGLTLVGQIPAQSQQRPSVRRFAVVIGAGDYRHADVTDLPACVKDARGIYNVLINPQVGMFPEDSVTLLLDEDATRDNVLAAMERLTDEAGKSDLVVVFFSGHGTTDSADQAYLLTTDADPERIGATSISAAQLRALLGRIKTGRLVVLIDSCFSAASANFTEMGIHMQGSGRVAITASRGDQTSIVLNAAAREGAGYSAFAWHVIRGLQGAADVDRVNRQGRVTESRDGVVTVTELWEYVKDRTERSARHVNHVQQPQLKGQIGSGFVLTVAEPDPDLRRRVETLYTDYHISASQRDEAVRLFQGDLRQLDLSQIRRRQIYMDLLSGRIDSKYLTMLLKLSSKADFSGDSQDLFWRWIMETRPSEPEAGGLADQIAQRWSSVIAGRSGDEAPSGSITPTESEPASEAARRWAAAISRRTNPDGVTTQPTERAETEPADDEATDEPASQADSGPADSPARRWAAAIRQRTNGDESTSQSEPEADPPSERDRALNAWRRAVESRQSD